MVSNSKSNTYLKFLLVGMLLTSLFITIVPELRNYLIFLFIAEVFAWFFLIIRRFQLFTGDSELDRVLKWFLYPSMAFNLFMTVFNSDYRDSGVGYVYLAMGVFTYLMYFTPSIQKAVIGIPKNIFKGMFWGIGIAVFFLILSGVFPGFSILVPAVPFSILTGVRAIVVIVIAPIMEELTFRSGLLSSLQTTYGFSFWTANASQGTAFTGYHFLAYGIFLGALETLSDLFGATSAIFGLLFTAFLFAMIAGYFVNKTKNISALQIAHGIINGFFNFFR